MPAERFFLPAEFSIGTRVCLSGHEHHHLSRVMRLAVGDEAELVNGTGGLATGRIAEVERELTTLEIKAASKTAPSPAPLILAIPLMRPSKLEWVVEKGTELGGDAFLLYNADHSEKDSLSEHQIERLRNLTISALKQSGRLYLPAIEILPRLEALFSHRARYLFGDTRPAPPLSPTKSEEPILFITGPEKGFSKREQSLLDQKAAGVRINPNILRAETAPLAALSILSFNLL